MKIRFVDGETVSLSGLGVHGRFIHKQLGLGYIPRPAASRTLPPAPSLPAPTTCATLTVVADRES